MAGQPDGSKEKGTAAVPEPEQVPVTVAQDSLGELLGRVSFGGEHFVITKHGKPVARLVPIDSAA